MEDYEWNECAITDIDAIKTYLGNFPEHKKELVLLQDGEPAGAILTKEQYAWFLDQIDSQQNLDFIAERRDDLTGAQSLEDMKKELGL